MSEEETNIIQSRESSGTGWDKKTPWWYGIKCKEIERPIDTYT